MAASIVGGYDEGISAFDRIAHRLPLMNWQVAYVVGGAMGLALLVRMGTFESGLVQECGEERGGARQLAHALRAMYPASLRYLKTILIGVPIWYVDRIAREP
ncbi:MAG: hypothetical protein IPM46_01220 [Flavobacteriales bacterium]|nr:hypothetical protein [Flavobacteriales bacterium]